MLKMEILAIFFSAIPVLIPIIASAIVWRSVERPVLYFAVSIFIMLGISWMIVLVFPYLFSEPKTVESFFLVATVSSFCPIILNVPMLYWLYKGLRHHA